LRTEHLTLGAADPRSAASSGRHVWRWSPDDGAARGVIHISHGMAEHAGRYARFAEALTAAGWIVYANDHRGHGASAATDEDLGYFADHDGWDRLVFDLREYIDRWHALHPGLPVFLFGHSMGSLLAQQYLYEHGGTLAGAILCGSQGKPPPLAAAGRVIARLERRRKGAHGRSRLMDKLAFGQFNAHFRPNRTRFDWLSRDDAEVDAYVADPRCGFLFTTQAWIDLLDGLAELSQPRNQARIRKDLPVHIVAGDRDPVGEMGASVRQLIASYQAAGLRRVTSRIYEGARHELLNETNRDEVTSDLVAWLESIIARS
jgi:alpha-beta hydrolase superfamily lysophospholipase